MFKKKAFSENKLKVKNEWLKEVFVIINIKSEKSRPTRISKRTK